MPTDNSPSQPDLHLHFWDCGREPKAVVMVIHGLNEHAGRYQQFAEHLNQHHYSVAAIDLPSHGHSLGKRGHINRFSDFKNAALYLYQQIRQHHPDKPVFLFGHSMGGLIASQLLITHQEKFRGAVLSGAALLTPNQAPPWQLSLVKLISQFWPSCKITKLSVQGISRDRRVVENYFNDPLVYTGSLSARFLIELLSAMQYSLINASKIQLPISILHGGADVITLPEGSIQLHQNISSTDKSLTIYDGLFHEILNDPNSKTVVNDITTWLDQR